MDIVNLIQNIAFPIAACMAMGWYVVHQDDKHDNEVASLREVVDNNTVAIVKLLERMDSDAGN